MVGKEADFERLSPDAQDFVVAVSSSAMEGVHYTKNDIEELMAEIGIMDDNEKGVIIEKLSQLQVLREGKEK